MTSVPASLAESLCQAVDWNHPGLAAGAARQAWLDRDPELAATAFVNYLRARPAPRFGYDAPFVGRLRQQAAPATRQAAREAVAAALANLDANGLSSCLAGLAGLRPEVILIGATTADLERYADCLAAAHDNWPKAPIHTVMGMLRYLQAVWPLAECPDEALVPPLACLAFRLPHEWAWARNWGEAMLGTEGHNWWVAQFGATWTAGLLFPELAGFARFQALYPAWFEREMGLLMRPDGFSRECSVSYHLGTVDLFLNAVRLARLNGLSFSPAFMERLRRCAEVEWKLMTPDGVHPVFGDGHYTTPYLLDRARGLAAMLEVPELKFLAEQLAPGWVSGFGDLLIDPTWYPSVGDDLRPAYDRLVPRPPAALDTSLPDSGYYVIRQDWTSSADYAAIEASARGNLVTSHGQGAIFDLLLYSRGRAITVGNGKGPCGSAAPERTWRVSTAGHTAASVDDQDHVPLRSVYRFDRVVVPVVDQWLSEPGFAWFSGAHEAYERLEQKVPGSRRKLFYRRGRYWILIDRFTAASPEHDHLYRQHFQLAVPASMLSDGRVRTLGPGGNLLFVPVPGAAGSPALGPCPYPLPGHPNPGQLVFSQPATGHGLFVTVLVPFMDDDVPDVSVRLLPVIADERRLTPWEATGLELVIGSSRDIFVNLHMHWNLPWECAEHTGNGRLFHSDCPSLRFQA